MLMQYKLLPAKREEKWSQLIFPNKAFSTVISKIKVKLCHCFDELKTKILQFYDHFIFDTFVNLKLSLLNNALRIIIER